MAQCRSRDRVLDAANHIEPDRIPIDYWAVDAVPDQLIAHFGVANKEQLLQRLQVDLRYVMGPSFAGQQLRVHPSGLIEDHWGVLRQPVTVTGTDRNGRDWSWTYKHLHTSPLAACETVAQIEAYDHWPSADM